MKASILLPNGQATTLSLALQTSIRYLSDLRKIFMVIVVACLVLPVVVGWWRETADWSAPEHGELLV